MMNPADHRRRAEVRLDATMRVQHTLTLAAAEDFHRDFDVGLRSLGVQGPDAEGAAVEAEQRLDELAVKIDATTTFEVLLAGAQEDRRLCFECQGSPGPVQPDPHNRPPTEYEIRRVFFRWSCEGSTDLGLSPQETEVAERFGRLVVPELAD